MTDIIMQAFLGAFGLILAGLTWWFNSINAQVHELRNKLVTLQIEAADNRAHYVGRDEYLTALRQIDTKLDRIFERLHKEG